MKVLTTPERPFRYEDLAEKLSPRPEAAWAAPLCDFRLPDPGYGPPVIVFDIYNNHGKLQTVKLILPIGSHKQLKKDHLGLIACLEAKNW